MNVLVTGAAGFIGRHFAQHYTAAGATVRRVDIGDVDYPVDARDYFRVADERFDLVIHAAAVVGGRARIEGAPLDLAVDLSIDAEMAQWALRTRPGRVVYFSSSAAYPARLQQRDYHMRLQERHIDLDQVETPDAMYGWIKLTGEQLCRRLNAEGVPTYVFRPFSGYGEDQALDYPFPAFAMRAGRRDDPFGMWGDGTQVRDWIHVDDIVGAVTTAVDVCEPLTVNLGSGVATTFRELAVLMCRAADYQPPLVVFPEAPTGVHTRVSNNDRMTQFYRPKISLYEGIQRALRVYERA